MSALEVFLALLALALLLLLARHLRELRKLRRWAVQARLGDPPEATGSWGRVFDALHRHRRSLIKDRRRLAQLIVRSRRGAQALPYGIAVLDEDFRLDWCNSAAREHLGLDPEHDRGQPIANFVRLPAFVEYLREGDFAQAVRLPAHGTPPRVLALQIVPFGDAEHLLLSHDVTGAEQLEAMRRDFVANVSHELRTPLTVLAGFLETIQDLKLDAGRVRDYIGLMAPQAERMKRLTEDLLTLSAMEHAPLPAQARVAVGAVLARVRSEVGALSAGKHRILLEVDSDIDLLGSESELASAFINLASNAVRYTPAGGEIRMSWRRSGDGAEFAVEDSGIGIEAEHLPRLTERFYRVDRSRSRETGGTGLGLSIVKHALARHQAQLGIASTPGKGSRFTARFPAARLVASAQKVAG
jgi:two-component system phosphate regulon sensor histidine kinase PhoR